MMNDKSCIITVSGNIGSGKTTFCSLLKTVLSGLGFEVIFHNEDYLNNPYLENFYKDKKKFGYITQKWFLEARAREREKISSLLDERQIHIFDRGVFDDYPFAACNVDDGNINKEEFEEYKQIYKMISDKLKNRKVNEIIILLDVNPEICLERVKQRGRKMEETLELEYLRSLDRNYKNHVNEYEKENPGKVIRIDNNLVVTKIEGLRNAIKKISS